MKKIAILLLMLLATPLFATANDSNHLYLNELKQAEKITKHQFSKYSVPVYKGKLAPFPKKTPFTYKDNIPSIKARYQDSSATIAGKYAFIAERVGHKAYATYLVNKTTGKIHDVYTIGEGIIDGVGFKTKENCGKHTDSITGDEIIYFKNNSNLLIIEVKCIGSNSLEEAVTIYHALQWQEKSKTFKWLSDKVVKMPQ